MSVTLSDARDSKTWFGRSGCKEPLKDSAQVNDNKNTVLGKINLVMINRMGLRKN